MFTNTHSVLGRVTDPGHRKMNGIKPQTPKGTHILAAEMEPLPSPLPFSFKGLQKYHSLKMKLKPVYSCLNHMTYTLPLVSSSEKTTVRTS